MDSCFQSAVGGTPPDAPAVPLIGHPQSGNPLLGQRATKPGPWWYYMITQELRNIIVAAGLTPDALDLNQVLDALQVLFAPKTSLNTRVGHAYLADDWAYIDKDRGLIVQWVTATFSSSLATGSSMDVTVTYPATLATVLKVAPLPGGLSVGLETNEHSFSVKTPGLSSAVITAYRLSGGNTGSETAQVTLLVIGKAV